MDPLDDQTGVSIDGGTPKSSILEVILVYFSRIFHYKSSSYWGTPHSRTPQMDLESRVTALGHAAPLIKADRIAWMRRFLVALELWPKP